MNKKLRKTGRKLHLLLIIALLAMLLLVQAASAELYLDTPAPESWTDDQVLKVTFLEAGRSDACLLECGGEVMMVDGGRAQFGNAIVYDLKQRGITSFKYLLNTHPDDDHIDGYNYILDDGSFAVTEFVSSFKEDARWNYHKRVVKKLQKAGIPYRQLLDGDVLTLGGARLEVHVYAGLNLGINARSAFIRLDYGNSSVLLTGDVPGAVQEYYNETLGPDFLHVDVVKVPHHGINAMNKTFINNVNPALAIVTNKIKGIGPATKNQMKAREIPVYYSGDGEVDLVTDGTDWYVTQKPLQTSKRYLEQ